MNPYRFEVRGVKHFLNGTLEGMRIEQSYRFTDRESADEFVARCRSRVPMRAVEGSSFRFENPVVLECQPTNGN